MPTQIKVLFGCKIMLPATAQKRRKKTYDYVCYLYQMATV